jgi:hypothetical protein
MLESNGDEIQLTPEEFDRLDKLNNNAVRVAQDAEIIVQEQKLLIAKSQKEIRDYMFVLSSHHSIDPTASYVFNRESKTLAVRKQQ